ncbi:hypothetical protein FOA52_007459 [Chlamydomonas sp. UWO 241]|nr:hypothetical protein FOA52_007459 [Chlamydomonas sp. UWO 241]
MTGGGAVTCGWRQRGDACVRRWSMRGRTAPMRLPTTNVRRGTGSLHATRHAVGQHRGDAARAASRESRETGAPTAPAAAAAQRAALAAALGAVVVAAAGAGATPASAAAASITTASAPAAAAGASTAGRDAPTGSVARLCDPERLRAVFSRLMHEDADGGSGTKAGGAANPAGLMAYYQRLGCDQATLSAAAGASYDGAVGQNSGDSDGVGAAAASFTASLSSAWADVDGTRRTYLAETAAFVGAAGLVRAWTTRPRGWCRADLVAVAPSVIAGTGLFARCAIPAGTVLGAYPGVPRSPAETLAKAEVAPRTRQYVFRTDDGYYLDPTDANGKGPSPFPAPGWWPLAVQVELAYANEPPPGVGTNCLLDTNPTGSDVSNVLFVTERDVLMGEEVFIDYGPTYDRSGYAR